MAAATANPPASKGRRRHPDLIFEWVGSKGYRWRLLLFINLSLALHVACFYAFKVVYPPTVVQRAETTKVTFLDPRHDPGVRAVIARIEDRSVFIDGSLRLPVPGASLEDEPRNEVVPVPGFASHEAQLRSPPEIEFSPALPKIFSGDDVFLPSQSRFLADGVRPVRPEPAKGKYVYRPVFVQSGGIAKLEIVARPDLSGAQKAFASTTGNQLQFLIEVDKAGDITSCLPWKGVETTFDAEMAGAIEDGMKFSPGEEVRRGWLEMRW